MSTERPFRSLNDRFEHVQCPWWRLLSAFEDRFVWYDKEYPALDLAGFEDDYDDGVYAVVADMLEWTKSHGRAAWHA